MLTTYDRELGIWMMELPPFSVYEWWKRRGWRHEILCGRRKYDVLITDDPKIAAEQWSEMGAVARDALISATNASRALGDGDERVVCNAGLDPYPFQRAGARAVLDFFNAGRDGALIADEQGLGKTIQAILVANEMREGRPGMKVVVVCPASLQLNWKKEIEKWGGTLGVRVGAGKNSYDYQVISYDQAHKAWSASDGVGLYIFDEAHLLKNPKSKRAKACVLGENALAKQGAKSLALTGTPWPNRASDVWMLLHLLDPVRWPLSEWKRFIEHIDGKDVLPHSQRDRLRGIGIQARLAGMVRRMKADVLPQLPEKQRVIIELAPSKEQQEADGGILRVLQADGLIPDAEWDGAADLGRFMARHNSGVMTFRRRASVARVPQVLRYLEESTEDCAVVFCYFQETLQALMGGLSGGCVGIWGGMSAQARQEAVETFQAGQARFFIGQIIAAGTGITLTRAKRLIMVDLDWTPGNMEQAEDRIHRIGQDRGTTIEYLAVQGSLDHHMILDMLEKQRQRSSIG